MQTPHKGMWWWRNSAILGCTDKEIRLEVTEHLYSGVICLYSISDWLWVAQETKNERNGELLKNRTVMMKGLEEKRAPSKS